MNLCRIWDIYVHNSVSIQSLTVPLKVTGSSGVHWIMAPLKCDPLAGKKWLQVSSKTANTGIILNAALIPLLPAMQLLPCYTTAAAAVVQA